MGIGDWGLGIAILNPQSPIPKHNEMSKFNNKIITNNY